MTHLDTPILPFDWLLTDELKLMRSQFAKHKGGRIEISADGLEAVLRRFDKVLARSKEYENEISRLRWNAYAHRDREQSDARPANKALLRAIKDPNSNVTVLMPRYPDGVEEVPFTDGRE